MEKIELGTQYTVRKFPDWRAYSIRIYLRGRASLVK